MNFESIEGLAEQEINELYFDEEKLAEWYGTFCKTVYEDPNSHCVSFFLKYSHIGHCALDCASTITFTADAMKQKCAELCGGGTEIALEANAHKHAHSATEFNGYSAHYCVAGCYNPARHHGVCYLGRYHSCFEAVHNFQWMCGTYGGWPTSHSRHEHPWPITWSRCQALKTR